MNDKHSQSNHPSMTQVLRSITQITPDEQTTHTAVAKATARREPWRLKTIVASDDQHALASRT